MAAPSNDDSSLMANAIRALAMDAVQQANSGHPGAPMGMAEIAVALWDRHLKHNPRDPHWADRDRFVLSNGHGSMLLYALLHLSGYDLAMSELRNFRQLHSKTPGHPEVDLTPGVETTTGPLGQGIGNAVGMALAEKLLAAEFNRPGHAVVNHRTYVFLGDGCMMEGISHEVCALAGAWKLNKLVALYDDNGISIDGAVKPWYVDNVAQRFQAYGWDVIGPIDGHDVQAVDAALTQARRSTTAPTLIICKTTIGKGSPNRAGTAKAHGEALGVEEVALTRAALGWNNEPFVVPEAAYALWDHKARGESAEGDWIARLAAYRAEFPELADALQRRMRGELPKHFAQTVVDAVIAAHTQARNRGLAQGQPDRAGSLHPGAARVAGRLGRPDRIEPDQHQFHAGLALRRGRRAERRAPHQLRRARVRHGRGDERHRAARRLHSLRRHLPDLQRLQPQRHPHGRADEAARDPCLHARQHRPGRRRPDAPERGTCRVAAADPQPGRLAPGRHGRNRSGLGHRHRQCRTRPSALLLSRQNLPYAPKAGLDEIAKGAYVLSEPTEVGLKKKAQAVIIATGSELQLALHAQAELAKNGIAVRVVSMPSTSVFDRQSVAYKSSVLPPKLPRIAVEAGVTDGWWKYGCAAVLGLDRYGESAPAPALFKLFGFTVQNLVDTVRKVLAG